jgi:hypothetical protein
MIIGLFCLLSLGVPALLGMLFPWLPLSVRLGGMVPVSIFLIWGVTVAVRPWHRTVPPGITTLAGLAQWVLSSNQMQWTRAMVSERVKAIVIAQLGTPEAKYSEDANFVRDFGIE